MNEFEMDHDSSVQWFSNELDEYVTPDMVTVTTYTRREYNHITIRDTDGTTTRYFALQADFAELALFAVNNGCRLEQRTRFKKGDDVRHEFDQVLGIYSDQLVREAEQELARQK